MAIPKKLIVGRRTSGSDTIHARIAPCDNKDTKAFKKIEPEIKRFSNLPVIEIDNEPLTGFRIVGSSYNRRQTDFQIEHPLGFQFDINTENMMDLIRNNDIIDVEFKNPLFFSDRMKLINYDSSLYTDMVKKAENEKEKRRLQKEMVPGTYFQDQKYADRNDGNTFGTYHYIGRFHVYGLGGGYTPSLGDKSQLLHVMFDCHYKTFEIMNTFRYNIVEKDRRDVDTKFPAVTGKDAVDELNKLIINGSLKTGSGTYRVPFLVSEKPIKANKIEYVFTDKKFKSSVNYSYESSVGECVLFKRADGVICLVLSTQGVYSGSYYNRSVVGHQIKYVTFDADGNISDDYERIDSSQIEMFYGYAKLKN